MLWILCLYCGYPEQVDIFCNNLYVPVLFYSVFYLMLFTYDKYWQNVREKNISRFSDLSWSCITLNLVPLPSSNTVDTVSNQDGCHYLTHEIYCWHCSLKYLGVHLSSFDSVSSFSKQHHRMLASFMFDKECFPVTEPTLLIYWLFYWQFEELAYFFQGHYYTLGQSLNRETRFDILSKEKALWCIWCCYLFINLYPIKYLRKDIFIFSSNS